jgi:hypothetical protein
MPTARELTSRLVDLLRREHHALAEFLVALAAFDAARGWIDLGYRSLFEFLVRELALPRGPAYYRMTAAGLIQKYPELVEPLRDGRLNLSSITQLAKVITPENRAEVVPRFFHLSKREAKEVVAELAPAATPPVRTVVTAERPAARAPAPSGTHVSGLDLARPPAVLPEELTSIKREAPEVAPAPPPRSQPMQVEPLTAERSRLHVTVSRRLLEKLAAARDALSHSHPGATEETILELGLDLIIERHRKRRGIGAKPRTCPPPPPLPPLRGERGEGRNASPQAKTGDARTDLPSAREGERGSRRRDRVPAHVWRAVWERDRGCCAWPLENGGVCGSTHQVELDHVEGQALGAGTTVDECRLLCRFHQDVSARRLYGNGHMNKFTRPKGGTLPPYPSTAKRGASAHSPSRS